MPFENNCTVNLPDLQTLFSETSCKLIKYSKINRNFESTSITVHLENQNRCRYIKYVEDEKRVECAGRLGLGVCREETGAVILCNSIDAANKYYLRDLSSWGDILCHSSQAYLYTKIAYYSSWINKILKPNH